MKEEIVNRVSKSPLVTLDLEELYPEGERIAFDISPWLLEGIVLKEQDFRKAVKDYDWSKHEGNFIAFYCSTDAIIPGWAYMLVCIEASKYASRTSVGSIEELNSILFSEIIQNLPIEEYKNKPVIIKGCAHKPIPQNAFVLLSQKLKLVAKSIMYGEACSSVPLYKRPK